MEGVRSGIRRRRVHLIDQPCVTVSARTVSEAFVEGSRQPAPTSLGRDNDPANIDKLIESVAELEKVDSAMAGVLVKTY